MLDTQDFYFVEKIITCMLKKQLFPNFCLHSASRVSCLVSHLLENEDLKLLEILLYTSICDDWKCLV